MSSDQQVDELRRNGAFAAIIVITVTVIYGWLYLGLAYYVWKGVLPADTDSRVLVVKASNMVYQFCSRKVRELGRPRTVHRFSS